MKESDLKRVYETIPEGFHDALHSAAQSIQEEKPMKKTSTFVLVMILVLAVACTTALAIANYYSVRQYQGGDQPSALFEKHIIALNHTYENDYITLTLGDAIFDGADIAMAMNITSKDEGKPVFLYPKLTAASGGRALDIDIEGMRGDFTSGFVFPNLAEGGDGLEGKYGFDAVLYQDRAEDDVRWTFAVKVLAPNWPIKNNDVALHGDDTDPSMEEYLAQFTDAYENQVILTTWGDSLVEYAEALPVPDTMTEEAFRALRLDEKLLASGAFTLVETVECVFDTVVPEEIYRGVGQGQTFPMDTYTVDFLGMDVSFMRVEYAFDLVYPAGTTQEMLDAGEQEHYELRDQNGHELVLGGGTSHWVDEQEDGSCVIHWEGTMTYAAEMPTEIHFIPQIMVGDEMVPDESHAFMVPFRMPEETP